MLHLVPILCLYVVEGRDDRIQVSVMVTVGNTTVFQQHNIRARTKSTHTYKCAEPNCKALTQVAV